MSQPRTLLGGRSPETFLNDYWQKKPLLVRGALPGFRSPLSPEELAGLACEEAVTSRLVLEEGGTYPWEMRFGPFEEETFMSLPDARWSLLVQEVDRLVPEVARLLDRFTFLPNWRLDDVQISYAPEKGTVGAHVDSYDVFLIQGLGRRRWQISRTPAEENNFIPDLDVRILQDFEPDEEWVLEPGDMLYLPPRIPHYGVALEDCMTYSVGFRAPREDELAAGLMRFFAEKADAAAFYADPGLTPPEQPGAIRPAARKKIRAMLRGLLKDDAMLDHWFGQFITRPQRGAGPSVPETSFTPARLRKTLQEGAVLRRSAAPHFAYIEGENGTVVLFAAGAAYPLEPNLAYAAPLITGPTPLSIQTLSSHLKNEMLMNLLSELVNTGSLQVEPA